LGKDFDYIPIWKFQVSPRAEINISRMINPQKEKEFFLNEEYLKKIETPEEYEKESKKRIKTKKDEEKFYLNSVIQGFQREYFRTKGFSIFRYQIPQLVEALQNIHNGGFDLMINKILLESGVVKKIPQYGASDLEAKEKSKKYSLWVKALSEKLKKEVKDLENENWTPDEIQLAFKAKYS